MPKHSHNIQRPCLTYLYMQYCSSLFKFHTYKYLLPNDEDELPKAGVDEAPKVGIELPKAGDDEAPNTGVEAKGEED